MADELAGLSEGLRPLYLYWNEARGEKTMPSRSEIDPVAFQPEILPNIILADVVQSPLRFRFRVMGTAITEMLGDDWTGRFIHEIPNIDHKVQEQYVSTALNGKPSLDVTEYDKRDSSLMLHRLNRYERLLLPLSEKDGIVSMLLGGTLKTTKIL